MRYLKPFNELNEGFNIGILRSQRESFESDWGCSIEDIEDVLLDISDLSSLRGHCTIKTPGQTKYIRSKRIPELLILAEIKTTPEEYKEIINTIKNRLSSMNIHIEDETLTHSRTKIELDIYYICFRLMTNSDFELVSKYPTDTYTR